MRINKILWSLTVLLVGLNSQVSVAKSSDDDNDETLVVEATAEQVLKQQPGVSVITSEDIKKTPPVNDLSDIIRKMPGVNLSILPAIAPRAHAVTTARSIFVVWGRKTP